MSIGIRVSHTVDSLERDMRAIPARAALGLAKAVAEATVLGNRRAQGFARKASGPHGSAYYKRITSEMTGPLSGEFGPTSDLHGLPVGGGYRHGGGNRDLERAAPIAGDRLERDVHKVIERLFWR